MKYWCLFQRSNNGVDHTVGNRNRTSVFLARWTLIHFSNQSPFNILWAIRILNDTNQRNLYITLLQVPLLWKLPYIILAISALVASPLPSIIVEVSCFDFFCHSNFGSIYLVIFSDERLQFKTSKQDPYEFSFTMRESLPSPPSPSRVTTAKSRSATTKLQMEDIAVNWIGQGTSNDFHFAWWDRNIEMRIISQGNRKKNSNITLLHSWSAVAVPNEKLRSLQVQLYHEGSISLPSPHHLESL